MVDQENAVSLELRDRFTFACFRVDDRPDRLRLERGLIAQLSRFPTSTPSADWLGRFASEEKIRDNGLWNTQHIYSQPPTADELAILEQRVAASLPSGGA